MPRLLFTLLGSFRYRDFRPSVARSFKHSTRFSCGIHSPQHSEDASDDSKWSSASVFRKSEGVSHSDANFGETEYYFEDGQRKVYPYYYIYVTTCKDRWLGRNILDVYSGEFSNLPLEEYAKRITEGLLSVNGKKVGIDYELKSEDVLSSRVHRHEHPVLARTIKIISDADDLIAVDKPPSVPVHPGGRFRHNSMLFILAKEHNLKGIYSIHRLDRLTSGVLLFARTAERAKQIHAEIQQKIVKKVYVARVEGNFPDKPVSCSVPLMRIQNKVGICVAAKRGKLCFTEFQKLSYNDNTSVVLCKPYTGRMHQIRVHLQYLGYPIINDTLYNCAAFGPDKGKDGKYGKCYDCLLYDVEKMQVSKKSSISDRCTSNSSTENSKILEKHKWLLPDYEINSLSPHYRKDESKLSHDSECYSCRVRQRDPDLNELYMCLHALKYEGTDWKFETELPKWAMHGWVKS